MEIVGSYLQHVQYFFETSFLGTTGLATDFSTKTTSLTVCYFLRCLICRAQKPPDRHVEENLPVHAVVDWNVDGFLRSNDAIDVLGNFRLSSI